MGYKALWYNREHYLLHEWRKNHSDIEFMWSVSEDLGSSILEKVYSKNRLGNSIFTAALDSPYYPPPGTCWDTSVQCHDQLVVDNPEFEGYNVDQIYQTLINYTEYRVRDQKCDTIKILKII